MVQFKLNGIVETAQTPEKAVERIEKVTESVLVEHYRTKTGMRATFHPVYGHDNGDNCEIDIDSIGDGRYDNWQWDE